jgi:DNA-binding MarR family transcriptional regulator
VSQPDVHVPPLAPLLAVQLEQTFRLLGRRIYSPSLRRLSAELGGLDRASIPLLAALEEKDYARPSELAAALELDPSTVSRQLAHLERLGLAERSADQVDGRASRISLTPRGRQNLSTVRDSRAELLEGVFADWAEGDQRHLNVLLDRLLTSLLAAPASTSTSTPTSISREPS